VPVTVVCLTRSRNAAGEMVVRLGVPLLDEYLEFLAGRCRPDTVLAMAYDLKVFFTVVGKTPRRVRAVDVLAFMTAQRTGGDGRLQVARADAGGVSARTLRRRLSSVSGLYGFLHVRGDVSVNPVPRGLPTRRERLRPGQGVPLVRVPRTLPRILEPGEVDALTAALRTHREAAHQRIQFAVGADVLAVEGAAGRGGQSHREARQIRCRGVIPVGLGEAGELVHDADDAAVGGFGEAVLTWATILP
jgi:hypothetical protein